MEENISEELKAIWRDNTPPPEDDPLVNDRMVQVKVKVNGVTVLQTHGLVCWSPFTESYVFFPGVLANDQTLVYTNLYVTRQEYDLLDRAVTESFGVTDRANIIIKGPPAAINYGSLPKSLRPKVVKIEK